MKVISHKSHREDFHAKALAVFPQSFADEFPVSSGGKASFPSCVGGAHHQMHASPSDKGSCPSAVCFLAKDTTVILALALKERLLPLPRTRLVGSGGIRMAGLAGSTRAPGAARSRRTARAVARVRFREAEAVRSRGFFALLRHDDEKSI